MKRPKHSTLSDAKLKALLRGLREEVAAPPDFRAAVLARLRREGVLSPAPAASAPKGAHWRRLLTASFSRPAPWGLALGSALALALVWSVHRPASPALAQLLSSPASSGLSAAVSVAPPRQALQTQGAPAGIAEAPPSKQPSYGGSGASRVVLAEQTLSGAQGVKASAAGQAMQVMQEAMLSSGAQKPGGVGSQESSASSQPGTLVSTVAPAAGAGASGSPGGGLGVMGSSASAALRPSARAVAEDVTKSAQPTPTPTPPTLTPLPTNVPVAVPSGNANSQVRNNVILASRGQSAQILFTVAQAGPVSVEIYDRLGRPVAKIVDGQLSAGPYSYPWYGAADGGLMAASGIYVVLIRTPTYAAKHKIMLVK